MLGAMSSILLPSHLLWISENQPAQSMLTLVSILRLDRTFSELQKMMALMRLRENNSDKSLRSRKRERERSPIELQTSSERKKREELLDREL